MSCILDLLRTYQTLAVGLLAFCGVIVALMGNSYIARRERDVKILNDKRSLKVTLLSELKKLKENVDYRYDDIGKTSETRYLISTDPLTSLFRESLDKLGLVPATVLDKVLPAYLAAEHLPRNLRVFHWQDTSADVSPYFTVISSERYTIARGLHHALSKSVGGAIAALDNWTPTAP